AVERLVAGVDPHEKRELAGWAIGSFERLLKIFLGFYLCGSFTLTGVGIFVILDDETLFVIAGYLVIRPLHIQSRDVTNALSYFLRRVLAVIHHVISSGWILRPGVGVKLLISQVLLGTVGVILIPLRILLRILDVNCGALEDLTGLTALVSISTALAMGSRFG